MRVLTEHRAVTYKKSVDYAVLYWLEPKTNRAPTPFYYIRVLVFHTRVIALSLCSQILRPGVRDTNGKSMVMRRSAVRVRLKAVSTDRRLGIAE